jgi:hypothetical protein
MKSGSVLRGIALGLLVLRLGFVVPAVHAGGDTIKIGILHSLSGTMAISESVLKDTVLMLIADQNKKGARKVDCWDGNWNRLSLIPRPIGTSLPKKPGNYS